MSFGLQDLVATSHEEMPRWYWLLSKTQGLSRFKPVEHSLAGTPAANENVVRIDGRKLGASNAHVSLILRITITLPPCNEIVLTLNSLVSSLLFLSIDQWLLLPAATTLRWSTHLQA